jgi:hypothetical protein
VKVVDTPSERALAHAKKVTENVRKELDAHHAHMSKLLEMFETLLRLAYAEGYADGLSDEQTAAASRGERS